VPCCAAAADATGGVIRLTEKPLDQKLEALYKSRSYQLAVTVAEVEQVACLSWLVWPACLLSSFRFLPFLLVCPHPSSVALLSPTCALPHSRCSLPGAAPQADPATLAGIRRQYGDFLYAKRDYDQAMEQ